jgi:hypothetical protein
MIFRFDDVCINADMDLIHKMTDFIFNQFNDEDRHIGVMWGISPLVHDMSHETSVVNQQRIFPRIWNAHSDHRVFYTVSKAGIPECLDERVLLASHGLVHVDHRLLSKEAQEMSILVSSHLAGNAKYFIPPFNKWNTNTEAICDEHDIHLIKFEDGWKCMEYNTFDPKHGLWYLHAREFTYENFVKWFNNER